MATKKLEIIIMGSCKDQQRLNMKTVIDFGDNSMIIRNKDLGHMNTKAGPNTQDNTRMVNSKVMEYTNGQMVICIVDNMIKTSLMVLVITSLKMEMKDSDSGKMASSGKRD